MKKLGFIFAFGLFLFPGILFGQDSGSGETPPEETTTSGESKLSCGSYPLEVRLSGDAFEEFDLERSDHKNAPKYWEAIDGNHSNPPKVVNPKSQICPDPILFSSAYKKFSNGETYARDVCRAELNKLVSACKKYKEDLIRERADKIKASEKAAKEGVLADKEEAFRTEFKKWIEKKEADLLIGDEAVDDSLEAVRQRYYYEEFGIPALKKGESLETHIGMLRNKEFEEIKTDDVIRYTGHLFSFQKNIEDLLEVDTEYAFKSEFKTLKDSQDEYLKAKEQAEKQIQENSENSKKTENIEKTDIKISYVEKRISLLTQSLLISGSGTFEVSKILNTKSNGDTSSNEGNLTLIKSLDQEQFCSDISNRDSKKWKKICDTNIFDKIIRLVSQVVGTLGVLLLIIAAVMLITARGDDTQMENGKQLILYSLGGLLIFFMSFILVQFIIDLLVW